MNKSIVSATILLLIAGTFFVTNDAIINFLSQTKVKFFHFIFYGIPAFIFVPIYLFFNGTLKKKFEVHKLLYTYNKKYNFRTNAIYNFYKFGKY